MRAAACAGAVLELFCNDVCVNILIMVFLAKTHYGFIYGRLNHISVIISEIIGNAVQIPTIYSSNQTAKLCNRVAAVRRTCTQPAAWVLNFAANGAQYHSLVWNSDIFPAHCNHPVTSTRKRF